MHSPILFAVSFLLALATILPAQDTAVAPAHDTAVAPAQALAKVTETMQTLVDAKKVAGAITIVSHRGDIVYFDAVGKRDITNDLPMERDTIVRIYSMTKPVTSVAAMMLVEEGKIELDDPAGKYIPELQGVEVYAGKENGKVTLEPTHRDITIRDLLRHTSGLTYGFFGDSEVDRQYRAANIIDRKSSLEQMMKKLGKLPLLYQPGTKFNYSVSTDVLGRVVEVASGSSLDDFFRERIFGPLKMKDTDFFVPAEKRDRLAANVGPSPDGNGFKVIDAVATSVYREPPGLLSGGGGLVSTASDYMRFCQMLLNEGQLEGKRLLKEKTVAKMTRDQLPESAFPISIGDDVFAGVGFGLGVSVTVEQTEDTSLYRLGEFGWDGAASTHFWISPKDDLAVVVLTQLMPFTPQMENAVRPVVYDAIKSKR